jgi:hypothetical protein
MEGKHGRGKGTRTGSHQWVHQGEHTERRTAPCSYRRVEEQPAGTTTTAAQPSNDTTAGVRHVWGSITNGRGAHTSRTPLADLRSEPHPGWVSFPSQYFSGFFRSFQHTQYQRYELRNRLNIKQLYWIVIFVCHLWSTLFP